MYGRAAEAAQAASNGSMHCGPTAEPVDLTNRVDTSLAPRYLRKSSGVAQLVVSGLVLD
jgi:hypothetical protein